MVETILYFIWWLFLIIIWFRNKRREMLGAPNVSYQGLKNRKRGDSAVTVEKGSR